MNKGRPLDNDDEDEWWETQYSQGFPCCHDATHQRKDCLGFIYLLWRMILFGVMVASMTVTYVECDHFSRNFYKTTWQVNIVRLSSTWHPFDIH